MMISSFSLPLLMLGFAAASAKRRCRRRQRLRRFAVLLFDDVLLFTFYRYA